VQSLAEIARKLQVPEDSSLYCVELRKDGSVCGVDGCHYPAAEWNGIHGKYGGYHCVEYTTKNGIQKKRMKATIEVTICLVRNIFGVRKTKRHVVVTTQYAQGLAVLNLMLGFQRLMWEI
jgi:hypothetical protein